MNFDNYVPNQTLQSGTYSLRDLTLASWFYYRLLGCLFSKLTKSHTRCARRISVIQFKTASLVVVVSHQEETIVQ